MIDLGNSTVVIIAQIVGLLALLLTIASMQPRYRKNILRLKLAGSILFAVHFGLLGAMTGLALNAISAVRAFLFNRYHEETRPVWPLFAVLLLFIGVTIISWQGPISVIPLVAMLVSTVGFWQRNEQSMRRSSLVASPLWLTYNIASFSLAGIATEVLLFTSALIGLWRFRKVK